MKVKFYKWDLFPFIFLFVYANICSFVPGDFLPGPSRFLHFYQLLTGTYFQFFYILDSNFHYCQIFNLVKFSGSCKRSCVCAPRQGAGSCVEEELCELQSWKNFPERKNLEARNKKRTGISTCPLQLYSSVSLLYALLRNLYISFSGSTLFNHLAQ